MAKTFLTLMQNAIDELGSVATPTFVIGNTDPLIKQFLALANLEGEEFYSAATDSGGWPQLRKTHTFNLVPAQSTYSFPADYAYMLPETIWDRNYRWQLVGAISEQEWNVLQYGLSPSAPRIKFKISAGVLNIYPTPTAGQTDLISFSYISNGWCKSATGTPQSGWMLDTDTYTLDERCFIMGIKWRWLRAKGLDYTQEKMDYDRATSRQVARAGGARTLSLSTGINNIQLINNNNIPDTGYGQ